MCCSHTQYKAWLHAPSSHYKNTISNHIYEWLHGVLLWYLYADIHKKNSFRYYCQTRLQEVAVVITMSVGDNEGTLGGWVSVLCTRYWQEMNLHIQKFYMYPWQISIFTTTRGWLKQHCNLYKIHPKATFVHIRVSCYHFNGVRNNAWSLLSGLFITGKLIGSPSGTHESHSSLN